MLRGRSGHRSGVHSGRCLRFPRQARVHPLKYLNGLVGVLERRDVRLYGHTCATTIDEQGGRVTVDTGLGHKVQAHAVVVATNSPINDRVAIHTKQAPYRTYVIAGRIDRGSVPDALYWDTHDPYHYVRLQPRESEDLLIIGGADHKNGEADDGEARLQALEAWARRISQTPRDHDRWSDRSWSQWTTWAHRPQSRQREYLVATGRFRPRHYDGVVAGLLLSELILTGKSRVVGTYDPRASRSRSRRIHERKPHHGEESQRVSHPRRRQLLGRTEAWARRGSCGRLEKIAAFGMPRQPASSPAVGNMVALCHWNSLERVLGLSLPGSQFAADGTALNAPAFSALEQMEAYRRGGTPACASG